MSSQQSSAVIQSYQLASYFNELGKIHRLTSSIENFLIYSEPWITRLPLGTAESGLIAGGILELDLKLY